MPRILLEVDGLDPALIIAVTESAGSISTGQTYSTSSGVDVTFAGTRGMATRSWPTIQNAGEMMEFILSWGGSEALSVVATWLYGRLKGRVDRIRINKKTVPVTKEDILAVLQEARGERD